VLGVIYALAVPGKHSSSSRGKLGKWGPEPLSINSWTAVHFAILMEDRIKLHPDFDILYMGSIFLALLTFQYLLSKGSRNQLVSPQWVFKAYQNVNISQGVRRRPSVCHSYTRAHNRGTDRHRLG
jgi:hypothetical protein